MSRNLWYRRGLPVLMLMAALALMLALGGCSRQVEIQQASGSQKQIVLIVKSKNGDYWNTLAMGAEAAAKEFGVKLTFDGPESEDEVRGQQELVRQYLAYGMDALILSANDYDQLAPYVDAASRKGVPVIGVDSEVNSDSVSSLIGIDNYEAGREAAGKMKELAGDRGRFIILTSYQGVRNVLQRERGIRDEWSGTPEMEVAETVYCGSDIETCSDRTREALSGSEPVDGLITLSAAASVGAAKEIQRQGLSGEVKLVAFENSQEELEWLQEGVIQATLVQNPFAMGYLSVKTALSAMEGEKVEKRIVTETKIIDSESMFWSDNQKLLFPFVQ
ncbi:substrate-binding domain-containing protein [Cohnella lubricantis]|uniref:Substrate-binding domain-containing protein n=1 Tax=Cohnella lubricantis TaxID=2163172 RepID=A0A841TLJ3_9BACL|nr:substrate-binding domain-containing protein [Cohnella lubricantis]MBB6679797.1 substrate-binding domain-containing protein [Cohnella lubricantis]MBP2120260.1 ribose transport system substrate-binding protein [Cohnella lubricantis]